MEISVIIPTFNRQSLLARTLPTVFEQDFPSDQYEVIVVLDGSTDGVANWLRSLRPPCALKVIEQPHLGQAAALNTGWRSAEGEIVLFMDDDILCDSSLLGHHVRAHAGCDAVVAFGSVLNSSESPRTLAARWNARYWETSRAALMKDPEPKWPHNAVIQANCSTPRSLLLAVGGFDEAMTHAGYFHYDMGFRLWKKGVKFRFLPEATVYEIYCKSARDLLRSDAFWLGRNEVSLCRKHPEYRPFSSLARLEHGSFLKRSLRKLALQQPAHPELLLRFPLGAVERLPAVPFLCELGMNMMGKGLGLVRLRGAAEGSGSLAALRREFGVRLPVLMYHNVGPYQSGTAKGLTVSPELFRRQMRWLARRGYTGISAAQWIEWRETAKPLPPKPVLLTFDDAYEDIVEYALPVVQELGFNATVFVITGYIGESINWNPQITDGPFKLMRAWQIQEWAERGIEFGAHTRTHPRLTTLDEARLEEEIVGSREDLARLLGKPVVSFAYPYGDHNERVQACARQNFAAAFTTREGMNTLLTDPADLRRTMVWPDNSTLDFALKLRTGSSPITQHWRGRVKHAIAKRWRALLA